MIVTIATYNSASSLCQEEKEIDWCNHQHRHIGAELWYEAKSEQECLPYEEEEPEDQADVSADLSPTDNHDDTIIKIIPRLYLVTFHIAQIDVDKDQEYATADVNDGKEHEEQDLWC